MPKGKKARPDPNKMSFYEHLAELRARIVAVLVCLAATAAACYFYSGAILSALLEPLASRGYRAVFISPAEALVAKIKVALAGGFLLTLPFALYHIYKFISPALGVEKRRPLGFFFCASWLCFTGGVALFYFFLYRPALGLLLRLAGPDLVPMISVDRYVSFSLFLLFPGGIVCQAPLLAWYLAVLGVVSAERLAGARSYALLASLGLSAVLTPTPDAFTCLLLALPLYALYELCVLVARLVEKGGRRRVLW